MSSRPHDKKQSSILAARDSVIPKIYENLGKFLKSLPI
jgi:hypothetical protein